MNELAEATLDKFHLGDLMKCWHCDTRHRLLAWRIFSERAQCPLCGHMLSLERLAIDSEASEASGARERE